MADKNIFILEEIITYCDKIADSIVRHHDDFQSFQNDPDFQEACAFRVIQIGELVNSLSEQFRNDHPEIPWHNIIAFRNIVTHDYGRIDLEKMWDTITLDIPALKSFCEAQSRPQ